MSNVRIDMDLLCAAFPEAKMLEVLPRKKKKELKKKISKMLIALLNEEAKQIIDRVDIINRELIGDLATIKNELDRIEKNNQ